MSGGVRIKALAVFLLIAFAWVLFEGVVSGLGGSALAQPPGGEGEPGGSGEDGVGENPAGIWRLLLDTPDIDIRIGAGETLGEARLPASLQIVILLTLLTLAPALLILMTCFTRVVVVLAFVRNALSLQQVPPNQVIIGLALLLTFFIMAPVYKEVEETAIGPLTRGEIGGGEAMERGLVPIRDFMLRQTRQKDLALFVDLSGIPRPNGPEDLPTYVLLPAFAISELKTAFEMGFMVFVPFLVIDMVVASALMSMGMLMLPPVMISLPLKVLLFVLVDGWDLVVKSVVSSVK